MLPMLLLALGLHAALLALPIPSSEAQKEPDDKKNPITVTQIPTEKPTKSTPQATVNVPPLETATVADSTNSSSSASSGSAADSSAASTASDSSTDTATVGSNTATVPATKSTSASNSNASKAKPTEETRSSSEESIAAAEPSTSSDATIPSTTAAVASTNSSVSVVKPFADFPHYQPSEADCFGLGFGDNCRTIQSGAIAQVSEFFKKELAGKEFTVNLVKDEPTRKVFKVAKGNEALFLNIWQGKSQVAYLLSRVIVKQSPEQISTETTP